MFHEISPEIAEQSLAYLTKHYNIIDLNLFLKASKDKNPELLPKNPLIITFDDGHLSNYAIVETFRRFKTPFTIFVCSHIIGTKRKFWFKFVWEHGLNVEHLKQVSNQERLRLLKKNGFEQDKEFDEPQAMSISQIREIDDIVNIQSHTCYHPCLQNCSENELNFELRSSKIFLEEEFNYHINAIAYPNGDYSEKIIETASNLQYECGLTLDYGFNTIKTDLFKLKRFSVNDTGDLNEFIVKSSGFWSFITTLNGLMKPGFHRS